MLQFLYMPYSPINYQMFSRFIFSKHLIIDWWIEAVWLIPLFLSHKRRSLIMRNGQFSCDNIQKQLNNCYGNVGVVNTFSALNQDFFHQFSDYILKFTEFIPKASRRTLIFYCPASTVGKYVHISCNNQSVRFCEVSVLLPPGKKYLEAYFIFF